MTKQQRDSAENGDEAYPAEGVKKVIFLPDEVDLNWSERLAVELQSNGKLRIAKTRLVAF
jgi:hypothetical protein